MSCLHDHEVLAYLEGRLAGPDAARVDRHVEICEACFQLVAHAVRAAPEPSAPDAGASDSARLPPLLLDEIPGRYVVRSDRGHGGQASVFTAFDKLVGREVALKVLLPECVDSSDDDTDRRGRHEARTARLLREVRIAAQLAHPTVVPIYEFGRRCDGSLYYTMELVRGETLATAIRRCGDIKERMRLLGHVADLCNGIAYAHSRGVLHRDIKPANVMIGEFGETRIIDWGLAAHKKDSVAPTPGSDGKAWQEEDPFQTSDGTMLGTGPFMSPEQAHGQVQLLDERTDVWGLGAVLYVVLTGRPPFVGRSFEEVVHKVRNSPLRPILSVCPEAPRELAAIAEKALQRDPASRYSTVLELAEEVASFMAGRRVRAYDYTPPELVRRTIARHRTLWGAMIVVTIMSIVALSVVSVALRDARSAQREAQRARVVERQGRVRASHQLAAAQQATAEQLLRKKVLLEARVHAAASLQSNPTHPLSAAFDPSFIEPSPGGGMLLARAESVVFQAGFSPVAAVEHLMQTADVVTAARFSPDGRELAMAGADQTIRLCPTEWSRPCRSFSGHQGHVFAVSFSPDGRRLASASRDKTVRIWDVRDGKSVHVLEGHRDMVSSVEYSRDGASLVSTGRDSMRVWDPESGKLLRSFAIPDELSGLALSPDSAVAAAATADGTVHQWNPKVSSVHKTFVSGASHTHRLAYSPDGARLAVTANAGGIHLLETRTGKKLAELLGHEDTVLGLAFSPDGRWIASGSQDATVRLWAADSGAHVLTLTGHRDGVLDVSFSADGKFLVSSSGDRTVRVWRMSTTGLPVALEGHRGIVSDVKFAPNGQTLVSAGEDGTIRLWGRASGQQRSMMEGHVRAVFGVAFSPDGLRVASTGRDGTLRIWDAATSKATLVREGLGGGMIGVAFSPSGRVVAGAGRDRSVVLLDTESGVARTLRGHSEPVFTVAFSPDGRRIASASADRSVRIWDVETGNQVGLLTGGDWLSGVAWLHDGPRILTSGKDARATLWNVESGKEILQLLGHRQWANSVRLSEDDSLALTSGDDRMAILWSVAEGRPKLVIETGTALANADISPDGRTLAIPDGSTIRLWPIDHDLSSGDPVRLLKDSERSAGMTARGQADTAPSLF